MRGTFYKRAIALTIGLLLVSGCSSEPDPEDVQPTPTSAPSASSSAGTAAASFCEPATATPRQPIAPGAPSEYLAKKRYTLALETNCGLIEIEADGVNAPATVSTIGFLANSNYYDATLCHRLTTSGIFVLQCGDPQGDGGGNPGFTFADENLPTANGVNYPKGTVAMANSGPNTNGSQFFLVYADTTLPPNYSIWGVITKGFEIVEKIANLGTATGEPDGSPLYPVEIRTARLK